MKQDRSFIDKIAAISVSLAITAFMLSASITVPVNDAIISTGVLA